MVSTIFSYLLLDLSERERLVKYIVLYNDTCRIKFIFVIGEKIMNPNLLAPMWNLMKLNSM